MAAQAQSLTSATDFQEFQRHFKKISGESAVFFAGTLATTAAGYFFKIYLARAMGAESLGIYALGMTIVSFAGVLGAVGLPQSASRFVAAYSAKGEVTRLARFFWFSVIALCVTNSVVGLAVLLSKRSLAVRLYHTPVLSSLMHFFVVIMFLGALTTFLGQCLAGYKDVATRTVITNFIGTPLTMVLSIVLIAGGLGLTGYLMAQVCSASVVLILLARAIWHQTNRPSYSLSLGLPLVDQEVRAFSAVLFANQGLEVLCGQVDRVLLGIFLSARELGIYSVATAFVAFVPTVLQSINQIFAPTIAELHARGQMALLQKLYQVLTKWILALTLPLALVVIAFARPLMAIFGHDFALGWPILVFATLGQLINCGVGSVGQLLLMSGQQQRLLRAQMTVVVLSIVLNLLLIPHLGLVGAAVVASIANGVMNILLLRDVIRFLSLQPSWTGYISVAMPTAGCLVSVTLVRLVSPYGNLFTIALALLLGYFVFLLLMVSVGLDEVERGLAARAWETLRIASGRAMHLNRA